MKSFHDFLVGPKTGERGPFWEMDKKIGQKLKVASKNQFFCPNHILEKIDILNWIPRAKVAKYDPKMAKTASVGSKKGRFFLCLPPDYENLDFSNVRIALGLLPGPKCHEQGIFWKMAQK